MEKQLSRNLPETLSALPGVMVQKSSNGHGSPVIRGFTGYRTLTLIDGVRYNNSVYRDGPNEYFSLIDSHSIERLELLTGPTSTLYGTDGIGGTLNLQSKKSDYQSHPEGKFFNASKQHFRLSSGERSKLSRTEVQGGIGQRWGFHAGYTVKKLGNINAADLGSLDKTGYSETAFDIRGDFKFSENLALSVVIQELQQDDVWRTHSTVHSKSFEGTSIGSDPARFKDHDRRFAYARILTKTPFSLIENIKMTISHQGWEENGARYRDSGRKLIEGFKSNMLGFELQIETDFTGFDILYGVDSYVDRVDSRRADFFSNGSIDRIRVQGPVGDDAKFDLFGAYVHMNLDVHTNINLKIGSRYNVTSSRIGRFEDPLTERAAYFSDRWEEVVNSFRSGYTLASGTTTNFFWFGLSQSFRAPNLADVSRFGASRSNEQEIATTDLHPETFLTYEIGYRFSSRSQQLSFTAYRTEIEDYILSQPTGRTVANQTEVNKANSSSGFVQGIEASFRRKWSRHVTLWSNLTWLHTKIQKPLAGQQTSKTYEPLSRTMPLTVNFGATLTSPARRHWLSFETMLASKADELSEGDRGDNQRIPTGGTPGYEMMSITGGLIMSQHLEVSLKLENVFDKSYRIHGSGVNEPGFNAIFALTVNL
ncbi:MAG: TonB-dependent receptor [Pseudomonadota bacterium]|nr:TonB-dependent receptor [Pseudomonadota bacterium]